MSLTFRPKRVMNGGAGTTVTEVTMAGTLTISITEPGVRAMRALGYRLMWTAARDGRVLGWGHTHRPDVAEAEAWDLVVSTTRPDEVDNLRQIQR